MGAPFTWERIAELLRSQPAGARVRLARHRSQHPRDAGLSPTVALPVGQRADFQLRLEDGATLHVQDFGSFVEATLHPALDVVDGLRPRADGGAVLAGAAFGMLTGLLLARTKESAWAGLAIGAAAAAVAASAEKNEPRTSETDKSTATPSRTRSGTNRSR